MRYPDGGGLTAAGRARRAGVRLQAAQMLGQGTDPVQIAGLLQVSTKSVYAWRRAWRAGGEAALASKGPGGNPCKLDEDQLAQLRAALDAGPAAYSWREDQRWTLARVADLISRLFHVSYTLRGVSYLLHRTGLTPATAHHRRTCRHRPPPTPPHPAPPRLNSRLFGQQGSPTHHRPRPRPFIFLIQRTTGSSGLQSPSPVARRIAP
jgi:transposase